MKPARPTHSPIGASSMYRWSACPGSVRLSKGIESPESSYAREGTIAHEWAAKVLLDGKKISQVPKGEMRDAVALYVDVVRSDFERDRKFDKDGFGGGLWVEQHLDLSWVHPGCYGTADAVVYKYAAKLLQVYDFKFGSGIVVDPKDNPQLKYYALGCLDLPSIQPEHVEVIIVQPRADHPDGPVRRWRFPVVDILDFAADLDQAAERTKDPDAPLVPGSHCRFCPASGTCPELLKQSTELAVKDFSDVERYDPKELSKVLSKLPMLEAFVKSTREFAYAEAVAGRSPPGWKLVDKRATRKWKDEDKAERTIIETFDLTTKDVYTYKIKSPPQIEKLIGKKDFKLLDDHVVKESSGTTLAPESDNRPDASQKLLEMFD